MTNTLRSNGVTVGLGVFFAVLAGMMLATTAHAQEATPELISVDTAEAGQGDLIKCPSSSSVYLYGEDNKRYVFQNAQTFFSWYDNFDNVETIACADLATLPIGGIVPYQAGTRLIKIQTSATVYTVLPNGRLRAIRSEQQAINLFGENWAERVHDIDESFFPQYEVEAELGEDELPEGYLFEDEDGNDLQIVADGEAVELEEEVDDEDKSDPTEYRNEVLAGVIKHLMEDLDFEEHSAAIRALRRALHIEDEDKAAERQFKVARHALKEMTKAERKLLKAQQGLGITNVDAVSYASAEAFTFEAEAHLESAREAYHMDLFGEAYDLARLSRRASSRALDIMHIVIEDELDEDEHEDEDADDDSEDDELDEEDDEDEIDEVDEVDEEDDEFEEVDETDEV